MDASNKDYLDALLHYVPSGTTEGEKSILREAFVQAEEYAEIITPVPGSPKLLIGKKGSGKSAIIDFSMAVLSEAKIPAVLMKPKDFDFSNMPDNGAIGQLMQEAYRSMLRGVAACVGEQLSGLLVGAEEILYKEAISAGTRDFDGMGKSARLLSTLAKPLSPIDWQKLLPNTSGANVRTLERALQENISLSGKVIYLFIDDTDQVASPEHEGHFNRIWAFILAARDLAQKIREIRCVISLREEIWRALISDSSGQRDQTDHFLTLIFRLNPDLEHVQHIFEKRLMLAANRCGYQATTPVYRPFFEGEQPRMPRSNKRSSWPDLIRSRSRERPRDAIQLLHMLARAALAQQPPSKITDDILEKVMPTYSKERVKLLAQEFGNECPTLENILRTFAKIDFDQDSFTATAEAVRDHLLRIPSMFSVRIFEEVLRPNDLDGVIRLWALLYSTGFIYPRISDIRQPKKYRHIIPAEDPDFVSSGRWNDMQKALWEIHPAYRDFLIAEQTMAANQIGLPTKKRKPKGRGK